MTAAPVDATPSAAATVSEAVAALWRERKEGILLRVGVLDDAVITLLRQDLREDLRRTAVREAHKLAGLVGTFGFLEGSRVAREIEQLLDDPGGVDRRHVPRLSALVMDLRRELEQARVAPWTGSLSPSAAGTDRRSVLVVDGDAGFATRIMAAAVAAGLDPAIAVNPSAARRAVAQQRPDVVLLDPGFPDGDEDALRLLGELRTADLPVLVLTARDSFADRLEVANRGATAHLDKTLPLPRIIAAVQQALQRSAGSAATVLVVDDDPAVLRALTALLTALGLDVRTLDDPRRLFDLVEDTAPDLFVLDYDLPHADGVALCRALRGDPRWAASPVLFLTQHSDPATVQRMFQAGADDYLSKSLGGSQVAARILNRLERVRHLRQLADNDELTGIFNRRRAQEVLQHYVTAAQRSGEPVSLAVIDVDRFKVVNDRHGHDAGDEVLRHLGGLLSTTFRGEDVVARWGGEEFVVGMYGMAKDDGVHRVAEMLETLRGRTFSSPRAGSFSVTFSAGVAEFPGDGGDVAAVYRSADQALYRAKAEGRNRVQPAGAPVPRTTVVDVALVEDDDVLAGLVLHALETRGYSTCWLRDGKEAVDALVGHLEPRLLLLDWDLPGLSGLAVLRLMADSGALERTRAVMLTNRSTEVDVLEALELGAVDHVAKPFSLPVLMQRVRLALAR